jgi:hypothetical protein
MLGVAKECGVASRRRKFIMRPSKSASASCIRNSGARREDAIQGDGECGLLRCRNPSKHPCLQVSLSWPDGTTEGAKGAAIGTISLALTRIAIVELPWRRTTTNKSSRDPEKESGRATWHKCGSSG